METCLKRVVHILREEDHILKREKVEECMGGRKRKKNRITFRKRKVRA